MIYILFQLLLFQHFSPTPRILVQVLNFFCLFSFLVNKWLISSKEWRLMFPSWFLISDVEYSFDRVTSNNLPCVHDETYPTTLFWCHSWLFDYYSIRDWSLVHFKLKIGCVFDTFLLFSWYFVGFKLDLGSWVIIFRRIQLSSIWAWIHPDLTVKYFVKIRLTAIKLVEFVWKYGIACKMREFNVWMKIWIRLTIGIMVILTLSYKNKSIWYPFRTN